jgi:hypothetical protein
MDQRARPIKRPREGYPSTIVIPRWMRIAYVVFGLTGVAFGISLLVKGNSVSGGVQVAIGVGWLLVAAFKGRWSASHPKSVRRAA